MKSPSPYIMPDLGKVPPQAIDCEEAVLGIILLYRDAIDSVMSVLTPDMFYKEAHKKIYSACINIHKHESPVDVITVTEELRNFNELESVGGPVYISKLTDRIFSESKIEHYAYIIKDKFIRRELIRHSSELQGKSYDESIDIADLTEFAEDQLYSITDFRHIKEPTILGRFIDAVIDKIQKVINHEIKLIGIPSGLVKLDRFTGGFKDGEYVIIASRPSMGKSALALQIAINNGEQGFPIAMFSCEMSGESLAQRSISGASDKTNIELMQGRCEISDLLLKTEKLIKYPVFIDDSAGITVMEMRSKARKLKLKHDIKLIIIDYLQLMRGEGRSREEEVSGISRGLKAIAKDLNVPVIALSQLNRKSEERGEKRPQLSDLRESGSLEQDADTVIFLYRASYYGLRSVVTDEGELDSAGVMELIISKNRNGGTGSIWVKHNVSLTNIQDEITKPSPVDQTAVSF